MKNSTQDDSTRTRKVKRLSNHPGNMEENKNSLMDMMSKSTSKKHNAHLFTGADLQSLKEMIGAPELGDKVFMRCQVFSTVEVRWIWKISVKDSWKHLRQAPDYTLSTVKPFMGERCQKPWQSTISWILDE